MKNSPPPKTGITERFLEALFEAHVTVVTLPAGAADGRHATQCYQTGSLFLKEHGPVFDGKVNFLGVRSFLEIK